MRQHLALAAAVFLTACATPKYQKASLLSDKSKAAYAADAAYAPGVDVTEAGIRGSEFGATPDLAPIYFDYDPNGCDATGFGSLIPSAFQRKHAERAIARVSKRVELELGYALVRKRGGIVRGTAGVAVGDRIDIQLGPGSIESEVISVTETI